MSSDESTGTHISTFSNQTEKEKLKPHKPEQWEIDLIGNFLLNLYHRMLITPEDGWCIKKADARKEFEKNFASADQIKKFKELNGTANIGTLLHRCGFLIDTPRGSNSYKIKNIELFKFRNIKLKRMDDLRVNKDNIAQSGEENLLNDERNTLILSAEDNVEVDEEEARKPLKYQGTTMQPRSPNYYPTNASCCICEEEFPTMKAFEEHIQQHGE
ncbi:hypothetical protein DOY81_009344 [Sarcophaga bullata]|nr:hypothetical protein DOY81_009344 [Sarcophaga bullata]